MPSPSITKKDVAEALHEIAVYLELKGENPFKTRAYETAARAVEGIQDDIAALVNAQKIQEIHGIGESISEKITEFVTTGRLEFYEKLQKSIPRGLVEMLRIPGLGPKRAKLLNQKLGLKSIENLEEACQKNRLLNLAGFGEKSQENILKGIEFIKKHQALHRIDIALADAELLYEALKEHQKIIRLQIAGSIRRHKEVVKDIDLVASSKDPEPIMDFFVQLPQVEAVIAHGPTKSSIRLKSGISCDLRIVSDKEFPYLLHHLTGSKDHNVAMRARAQKMGMKMSEYGLFKGDRLIPCADEEEILKKMKLAYIPPELRENMGEIEAAEKNRLPDLLEESDIKGVFHCHSNWSDGTAALEDMIRAAEKLGLEYIGLTEHSQSAAYAGGLKPVDVKRWLRQVDELQKKFKKIKLLKGSECDILPDGRLDYPDEILALFDFVVGSVHQKFGMTEEDMTARIIRTMQSRHLTILGHPTGRLLLERDAYPINITKIIDAAAEHGVIIELNANPHRLDLDWRWGKYAKQKGVRVAIDPDAHKTEGIADYRYGVGIARKGWLGPKDVVNTAGASKILQALRQR